jgi:hypothetical protein
VILFSAAVPGQGGLHHVNEQWQSYWASLFLDRGYDVFDALRPRIWRNENVSFWYRQNAFVAVSRKNRPLVERLDQAASSEFQLIDYIHPEMWASVHPEIWVGRSKAGLRALLRQIPQAARAAVSRRMPGG